MGLTIIIPAAGEGSRFAKEGFIDPKPFIKANGVPMIDLVVNMFEGIADRIVVIGQKKHEGMFRDRNYRDLVLLDKKNEGAALSVLSAEGVIPDDEEVAICNVDNLFDWDLKPFFATAKKFEGAILTFPVEDGPWSYVLANRFGKVLRVKEKEQISKLATAGLYYFRQWRLLRNAICKMISEEDRYNGEFYLAPAYNYLSGDAISIEMPTEAFISLGTPEALAAYHAR